MGAFVPFLLIKPTQCLSGEVYSEQYAAPFLVRETQNAKKLAKVQRNAGNFNARTGHNPQKLSVL